MQTTFEKLGGTYRQVGDYLLPDIEVPESPQIGIWGQRRLQYLRINKRVLYTTMLMGDTLKAHLEEVDKSAEEMFDQLIVQLKAQEDVIGEHRGRFYVLIGTKTTVTPSVKIPTPSRSKNDPP